MRKVAPFLFGRKMDLREVQRQRWHAANRNESPAPASAPLSQVSEDDRASRSKKNCWGANKKNWTANKKCWGDAKKNWGANKKSWGG